jgi:hypothetical protein
MPFSPPSSLGLTNDGLAAAGMFAASTMFHVKHRAEVL